MTAACFTVSLTVGFFPHGTPSLVEFIGVPWRFSCSSKPTRHGALAPLTARLEKEKKRSKKKRAPHHTTPHGL